MYGSAPTEREGERIEQLVPEAITTTANARVSPTERPGYAGRQTLRSQLRTPGPARNLAVVALVEAVALIGLLAGWGLC